MEVMDWTLMNLEQHLGRFLGKEKMTSRYCNAVIVATLQDLLYCWRCHSMIKAMIEFVHLTIVTDLNSFQYNISTFNIVTMITIFSLSQMAIMFMKIDTNCDGTVDWVSLPVT